VQSRGWRCNFLLDYSSRYADADREAAEPNKNRVRQNPPAAAAAFDWRFEGIANRPTARKSTFIARFPKDKKVSWPLTNAYEL